VKRSGHRTVVWIARLGVLVGAVVFAVVASLVLIGTDQGRGDVVLALVEFVLVITAVLSLLAYARGSAPWPALAFAILVGITVAPPFGLRATPTSVTSPSQRGVVDPAQTHRLDVAGLSVVEFKLYSREIWRLAGEGGYPTHSLRVRSWIEPLLAINGTTITEMCGVVTNPCGESGDDKPASNPNGIDLFQTDGRWHVRTSSAGNDSMTGRKNVDEWELSFGVVSVVGAAFWILVALSTAVAVWTRNRMSMTAR
jgi:hypothetical protein